MTATTARSAAPGGFLGELEAFADVLAAEQALRATAAPPASPARTVLDWAERHRRIDGRPFSLDRFAPLRAIYADEHPHIVVMKPAQRGVSEWAINRTCFALEQGASAWDTGKDGLNVGYLFPTQAALGDFSKERLTGLRDEGEHLRRLFGGSGAFDGVTFKQVGRSYLYLRGAWAESALLSFAADVLVLDEFDRMDPKAVALARRRLGASVLRHELDLSTPTLPGRGIHAQYLQSDQRVYEQPCPACGAWHVYEFFRDVRADGAPYDDWRRWDAERLARADVRLTCPACGHALTDAARCAEGRWVARRPEVTRIRGYHIPALAFPFVSPAAFAATAVSTDPAEVTEFYRSDLGLPYEVAGARITADMLAQLAAGLAGGLLPDGPWRDTTMGVDVGARYHYRVSSTGPDGGRYVRAMGAVRSWDDLDALMARYRVRQCVIDALPELHGCREWAAEHRGKVLRAFYPGPSALPGKLYRVDDAERIVQINRAMAMDRVYAAVATATEHWPAAILGDPEVVAHLGAPVRVTTTDDRGQEQVSWEHTAPDHLFHAAVYDLIARAALPKPAAGILARGSVRIPGVR